MLDANNTSQERDHHMHTRAHGKIMPPSDAGGDTQTGAILACCSDFEAGITVAAHHDQTGMVSLCGSDDSWGDRAE